MMRELHIHKDRGIVRLLELTVTCKPGFDSCLENIVDRLDSYEEIQHALLWYSSYNREEEKIPITRPRIGYPHEEIKFVAAVVAAWKESKK